MNLDVEAIAARVRELPALPAVVTELLVCFEQQDVCTHAIAERIARDQAIAARTLRLANSSFYGMSCEVKTIREAIAVLGLRSTRTLVTAVALRNRFAGTVAAGLDLDKFWRHSVATALAARSLARVLRASEDEAFVAGLLHDIGRLVLASSYQEYAQVVATARRDDCPLIDSERALLGVDHAQVGEALACQWRFSPAIQAAVAGHHAPPPEHDSALTGLVHLADVFSHALDLAGEQTELVPPPCSSTWRAHGLNAAQCEAVFTETERRFAGVCAALAS